MRIICDLEEGHEINCPEKFSFETVAMFIDVSGFTKMSEILEGEGKWGSEKLAFYLNRYLEQVAKIVGKEGGDVFKFAGDAMIIIWPPYNSDDHGPKQSSSSANDGGSMDMSLDFDFSLGSSSTSAKDKGLTKEEYGPYSFSLSFIFFHLFRTKQKLRGRHVGEGERKREKNMAI